MSEGIAGIIRALPQEAFREPSNRLAGLTCLEKIRWLQQTAYFIWKHKGAARAGKRNVAGEGCSGSGGGQSPDRPAVPGATGRG